METTMSHLEHLEQPTSNFNARVSMVVQGKVRESAVPAVPAVPCKKLQVGVNEAGRRVGESHQNAKLSDDDVRMILELHCYHGVGYAALAAKFESSKSCIQKICNGSRRAKAPVKYH